MNLLQQVRTGASKGLLAKRYSLNEYADDLMFTFGNQPYMIAAPAGGNAERPGVEYLSYARSILKANGPVFACFALRMLVFSEARFQWQKLVGGRPGDLFGNAELGVLETPWPNATTGELLARMEQDTMLAGNFFAVREGDRLRRLRPDWVQIILTEPAESAVKSDVAGYLYTPGGLASPNSSGAQIYAVEEVAHWSPIPDPEYHYKGMSWVTPIIREVMADRSALQHKLAFFDNAATPQLAVTLNEAVTKEQFEQFVEAAERSHAGVRNAYRTLYLGGGADVHVVGKDLQQLEFTSATAAGETRIAAAARVPPTLVGFSEGIKGVQINAANFAAARRAFAGGTMRPLWRSAAAALAVLLNKPAGSRLWYDDRDIDFLREDRVDVANVQQAQSVTIRTLVDAGYEPESAVAAVTGENFALLRHTGLYSVQLQPPGNGLNPDTTPEADPTVEDL